jgi:putative methyltransferase
MSKHGEIMEIQPSEPAGAKPRILISEPSATDTNFLPYMIGILKSYWEHYGTRRDAFTWLDPLWLRGQAEGNLDDYYQDAPDVLGLSCYTWNWDLQCKLARWAKQRNPQCLVVAGGPDPDYKDPEFFRKHPEIDMVVVKDGEIPFTAILETYLKGGRDFRHVPGLYLPSTSGLQLLHEGETAHLYTGPAVVPTEFTYSPYLEQTEIYERLRKEWKGLWIHATLETNRGCPYTCTYCDWGSSTMSKLRRFDMSRVEAEIDWFGRIGVNELFMADANFGILPRDIDIADRIVEARAKYGSPVTMYYSSAKNNPDRVAEIAKRTFQGKVTGEHVLAVQHTDPEVLAGTDRSNISPAKYREVVRKLSEFGIPCEAQLILGIPGDTVDKWKSCLGELMEWGVHDNYQVSVYALLPNAPAADRKFKLKWDLRAIDRRMVPYGGSRDKNAVTDIKSRIVVGWRGYGDAEWLESVVYSGIVRSYHNRAVTRLPAMYLRFVHGVSYREFYDAVIDDFCRQSPVVAPLYRRVYGVYKEFLANDEASDGMELEDFPNAAFDFDPIKWLYTKTCLRVDEFYAALSTFLINRFPQARNLESAVEYQKQLLILPSYDSKVSKTFKLDHDWPSFFKVARGLTEYRPLEEPTAFLLPRHAKLAEADRRGRDAFMDFGEGSEEERQHRWLRQSVRTHNSEEYSNYRDPQLSSAKATLLHLAKEFASVGA